MSRSYQYISNYEKNIRTKVTRNDIKRDTKFQIAY